MFNYKHWLKDTSFRILHLMKTMKTLIKLMKKQKPLSLMKRNFKEH